MQNKSTALPGALLSLMLLAGCAGSTGGVSAPETLPGDQLQSVWLHGKWCTNREETAQRNKDANFSAMTNLRKQYWYLRDNGAWQMSDSGFLYSDHGSWKIDGKNSLLLSKGDGEPHRYRATFANEGEDLVLQSESREDFLVMERCN